MQTIQVAQDDAAISYQQASRLALSAARENQMQDPTIIAWRQHGSNAASHLYEGADPATWWAKYGEGNGGNMDIKIGNSFDFILVDSQGYETIDQLPLRNIPGADGQEYICLTPLMGGEATPNARACVPIDEWMADQY